MSTRPLAGELMEPKYEPTILEAASARHDWHNRDPFSICHPLKPRKQAPKRQQPPANRGQ